MAFLDEVFWVDDDVDIVDEAEFPAMQFEELLEFYFGHLLNDCLEWLFVLGQVDRLIQEYVRVVLEYVTRIDISHLLGQIVDRP